MQSYKLEDLSSTFAKHEAEFDSKQMRTQFQQDHPGENIPEWIEEKQFNLARALCVMCCEIEKLKISLAKS